MTFYSTHIVIAAVGIGILLASVLPPRSNIDRFLTLVGILLLCGSVGIQLH